jgi:hypothetical protein
MSANVSNIPPDLACVEHGIWTVIPIDPPTGSLRLKLKEVDPDESRRIKEQNVLTFHAIGCSGDYDDHNPGYRVAHCLAEQASNPAANGGYPKAKPASFLFHLGDVVYKAETVAEGGGKDQPEIYQSQFYRQYSGYSRNIFAVAGNHDGKVSAHVRRSAIHHFLLNFCAPKRKLSPDNTVDQRPAMIQPYPYWVLEAPLAYFVGLYTNIMNGGHLDNPQSRESPQQEWLIDTLKKIRKEDAGKAVVLALHYPPYSGCANFPERGDPNLGPTPKPTLLAPLATVLQKAFAETKLYPDLVISAHAHLYQRIRYTYANGDVMPFLVAGNGGHSVEKFDTTCAGKLSPPRTPPFPALLPRGFQLPAGDKAEVLAYNDTDYGFLRITIEPEKITGEFFSVFNADQPSDQPARVTDSFTMPRRKR